SKLWDNSAMRVVLDGWQVSGVTSLISGMPIGIGCNGNIPAGLTCTPTAGFRTTDSTDITGGGDGSRVVVIGKATLPRSERTFQRWFNTSAFARPAQGNFGNAPKDVFQLPGVNNWDISLFKNFYMKSESRYLQ